jgi:hypothetical protein
MREGRDLFDAYGCTEIPVDTGRLPLAAWESFRRGWIHRIDLPGGA